MQKFIFILFIGVFFSFNVKAEEIHNVEIKKIFSDMYEVTGSRFLIKTIFCFEAAETEDAIIIINSPEAFVVSPKGFLIGRVIFLKSKEECDVTAIYRQQWEM